MKNNTNDTSKNSDRAPLVWEIAKKFSDTTSGIQVVVSRARLPGFFDNYIHTLKVETTPMTEDGQGKPFIRVMFERESLGLASQEPVVSHDYTTIISGLVHSAVTYVEEQMRGSLAVKQSAAYERDLNRAKHGIQEPRKIGHNGKTEKKREREQKARAAAKPTQEKQGQ